MFAVSLGGSLHSRFVDLEREDLAILLAALSWHYAEYHSEMEDEWEVRLAAAGRKIAALIDLDWEASVARCQKQMKETP